MNKDILINLLESLRFAELFTLLEANNSNNFALNRLKTEFIHGKTDIDWSERLKVYINSNFRTEEQHKTESRVSYNKVFNEFFNNNDNNWLLGYFHKTSSEHKILNNQYIITQNSNGGVVTFITLNNFSFVKNFTIEISMNLTKGVENNGFGINWGGAKLSYYNCFYISGNGQFCILTRKDNINEDICPWQISNSINKGYGTTNVLRIEVSENETDFFINNQLIYSLNSLINVYGKQIGVGAYSDISFSTNYIKVFEK